MKKTLKGFYLLVSSLFITLLHLPFAFGKPSSVKRLEPKPAVSSSKPVTDSLHFIAPFKSVYDSLHLELAGLSKQAFEYAQKGWRKLVEQGKVVNESVIAIVDFSQPSSHRRLYVLDMKNYKVLYNTLVAHGRNSGKEWASAFSNRPSSYMSSPGFYITGETYQGSNGFSLKLQGIERGINDLAYKRAIVMHGADYVDESYVAEQGYIGRSQGCPAVPADEAYPIINTIKNGTCLFIYTPDKRYVSRSGLLRG
ncbi:MAG: murein L,D-transpeptidase catalytic domain family protein [Chitinophagaceae bacterium]|nr:murein L,D-transpeptidase catalytic domain family protein [Chitinophagaceae bacterium]